MLCLLLLLASSFASTSSGPQTRSNSPLDTAFYAVSYCRGGAGLEIGGHRRSIE
jgi:hypothetical protein